MHNINSIYVREVVNGKVTIPYELLRAMGVTKNDLFIVRTEGDDIILTRVVNGKGEKELDVSTNQGMCYVNRDKGEDMLI